MSVKDLSKFKINNSHTIQEYFFNYGHLYNKGKLLKFDLSETWAMDPKRKYWELKDFDGVIRYFEIPYGNKLLHFTRPTYVKHRTAKRCALGIMLGAFFVSCTSFTIGKVIFGGRDVKHIIVNATNFKECYISYLEAKEAGGDNFDPFNLDLDFLTNAAMASTLYEGDTTNNITKKHMLVVNHGHTISNAILFDVHVDISSYFLQMNDGYALEEAVSYGSQAVAPKVSKRDYFLPNSSNPETGNVSCYGGTAKDAQTSDWDKTPFKTFTKSGYMDEVGKNPTNPFVYTINKDSILTDKVYDEDPITKEKHYGNSNKVKNKDGSIDITIDLHNVLGVGRYIKRIKYLSGKDAQYFNSVKLKFHVEVDGNKDLKMTSMSLKETFAITALALKNDNEMTSKFFYDEDAPDHIPDASKGENFDYNKYR